MYSGIWCVLLFISVGNAAKILGVFMTPSYSHQIVYQPIWRELSLRGHQVTVYTPNPLNDPSLSNLTEVDLGLTYQSMKNCSPTFIGKELPKDEEFRLVLECYSHVYDVLMSTPEIQKLITNENNEHYDLFLVEYLYPGIYPFKDVYKCPMVGINSLGISVNSAHYLGLYKHPILDPEFILPFSTDLTFKERIISTVFNTMLRVKSYFSAISRYDAEARKFFGKGTRSVVDIASDVSVVLVNSNYALQNIRPLVPVIVEISGMHLQPLKPLPQKLQTFLDSAKEGVVYMSLGTNVKISSMPKERLDLLLSAFSELPYKVLWKFETDDLTNLPSNVKIEKWLPQQDVLRHRNVKLFITQGGIQSIDEAVNSTVPMLVIPFFGDQHYNADKLVKNGIGLSINFYHMTKEEIITNIKEVITNPEYKNSIKKLAAIAYDQPMSSLEKAMWWIEYVLRHNGAPHLQYKAVNMPFYQYHLLDVYAFLALVVFIAFYILFKLFKIIEFGYCISKRMFNKTEESKISDKKFK